MPAPPLLQVQKLFGHDPSSPARIVALVALQLTIAFAFRGASAPSSLLFWAAAYVVGGTATHALFMFVHELAHGLCFKRVRHNAWFAVTVANLPIPAPYAAAFPAYHADHHKYLGVDGVDVDLPTQAEAAFLGPSALGKAFFAAFHVFFYALRPLFVRAKPMKRLQVRGQGLGSRVGVG